MSAPSWMTEEHRLLQQSCRRFFAAELEPHAARWRQQGCVDRDFWRKAGELGLLGGSVPEEYGGAGGDLSHDAVICLELGRTGDASWGYGVQSIVLHYLLAYADDAQKQRWLPKLVSGEWVAAVAMTEPGTGSDLQAIRTSARIDGSDYLISGSKTFITNGQTADLIIVVARTGEDGAHGVSLIGVETAGLDGFRRGRNLDKMGMKGQDTTELFFDEVRVPRANLVGAREGQGFVQLMKQLPWERTIIGIGAVGMCETMLRETTAYVRERRAFGKRLMDFQNTRFKLAECKTRLEVVRAFVDQCVAKLAAGELDAVEASMAKLAGSQMSCEIADECLQLFGGYGYMSEFPIARMFVDARAQKIYAGTNEIQKELIARSLDA